MRTTVALLALLLTLVLPIWSAAQEPVAESDPGRIDIGVVYPLETVDADTLLREGLELAFDEVNGAGGVLGKQLNPLIRDDKNDIMTALVIGQSLIDQGVAAVIGHWSSIVTYVVEDLYESAGTVMISPAATSESLFEDPVNYLFRTIPGCKRYAALLASEIAASGCQNIAIYYSDDVYGYNYANYLEKYLQQLQINVTDRITSLSPANAERIAERWRAFGTDGVFVAAVLPDAADATRLILDMRPELPVFGAENFERLHIAGELGGDTSRLRFPTYDLDKIDRGFLATFRARYGHDPDVFAITGYQAVMLLRDAFEHVGGTDPDAVAHYIRTLEDYPSIVGSLSFSEETWEFLGYSMRIRQIDRYGE